MERLHVGREREREGDGGQRERVKERDIERVVRDQMGKETKGESGERG